MGSLIRLRRIEQLLEWLPFAMQREHQTYSTQIVRLWKRTIPQREHLASGPVGFSLVRTEATKVCQRSLIIHIGSENFVFEFIEIDSTIQS